MLFIAIRQFKQLGQLRDVTSVRCGIKIRLFARSGTVAEDARARWGCGVTGETQHKV